MNSSTKNSKVSDIIETLSNYPLEDKVEILANVFVRIGVGLIDKKSDERIKDVTKYILDDLECNGETLPNALARQGLLILTWLSKEKTDEKVPRNFHNI